MLALLSALPLLVLRNDRRGGVLGRLRPRCRVKVSAVIFCLNLATCSLVRLTVAGRLFSPYLPSHEFVRSLDETHYISGMWWAARRLDAVGKWYVVHSDMNKLGVDHSLMLVRPLAEGWGCGAYLMGWDGSNSVGHQNSIAKDQQIQNPQSATESNSVFNFPSFPSEFHRRRFLKDMTIQPRRWRKGGFTCRKRFVNEEPHTAFS